MSNEQPQPIPDSCPVCRSALYVTRLQCPMCGTEVAGTFALARLAGLREPHASLIELFLRVRGNVKDMERALGLSYPTVRARLEEALAEAGFDREGDRGQGEMGFAKQKAMVLDQVERGEISAAEASRQLRELKTRRPS